MTNRNSKCIPKPDHTFYHKMKTEVFRYCVLMELILNAWTTTSDAPQ